MGFYIDIECQATLQLMLSIIYSSRRLCIKFKLFVFCFKFQFFYRTHKQYDLCESMAFAKMPSYIA